MQPLKLHPTATLIPASLLCAVLASCASDPVAPAPASEISLNFRVETSSVSRSDSGTGYEDASKWENFVDISSANYRIGFFDTSNLCITPFIPTSIEAEDKGTYIDYILSGEVPPILTLHSDFKIVVLANWDSYPDMVTGVTTIDDLCCPTDTSLGRFRHFPTADYQLPPSDPSDNSNPSDPSNNSDNSNSSNPSESSDPTHYIPMFGVKEYSGVRFGIDNEKNPVILYQGDFGPVNMLRAIAKVEVIFAIDEGYELDSSKPLYITHCNDYGYCAPEGAYREADYCHTSWDDDYRQGFLHLVGGGNDSAPLSLDMTPVTNDDNKTVWVAYLPEYRNTAITADATQNPDCHNAALSAAEITKARIAIPLIKNGEEYTSYIDFATYSDGEPVNPINIERNNLYRFTITKVDPGVKWKVEALPWNGLQHEEIVM